jgi:xylulose-5-phosphate/fructose-6-phosphate phosphoketolase
MDAVDRLPQLGSRAAPLKEELAARLAEHKRHIREKGEDLPAIRNWRWSAP